MGYVIAGVIIVAVLYFVLRPDSGSIKSIFKRGGGGGKQKH